jgi:ectoine hydroxylase-related dioxygenase (phytanoyl-CoA dioxygenase family)
MHGHPSLRLETDGAEHHPAVLADDAVAELRALADTLVIGHAGVRLFGYTALHDILAADGAIGRLAAARLGDAARPVRAILFDKTADANWAIAWHQDRTVAVRERREVPGFGPWTVKAGVAHVEPPFAIIARMITIRAHLDDCAADNAPLWVLPGSHRLGRVAGKSIDDAAAKLGRGICLAAAGDAWVYATSIIHASERARVPGRRRVLHVDYAGIELPGGLEWLGV